MGARWDGPDLVLELRVQPRAARDELKAEPGGLKLRLTAPPVEGRANRALTRYLAKALGVAPSAVEIEAGAAARDKRVRVRSADPARWRALGMGTEDWSVR